MEVAPELQFKHYTLREAHVPADALIKIEGVDFEEVALCCDLDAHVFNPDHTAREIADALRASHWFDLRQWASRPPGTIR